MKSKILGLLAVGLLVGPMVANASLLNFALTDGTNNIAFQLDSNPTPSAFTSLETKFDGVSVSVNGTPSPWSVWFYLESSGGGLGIFGPGYTGNLLNQAGKANQQIFSGDLKSPVFAPGTFDLLDYVADTNSTFNSDFRLVISAANVPEPGTLALLGLGLAGLGLSRRRKAN